MNLGLELELDDHHLIDELLHLQAAAAAEAEGGGGSGLEALDDLVADERTHLGAHLRVLRALHDGPAQRDERSTPADTLA